MRILFLSLKVVGGILASVLWAGVGLYMVLEFAFGYGNPPDSYTGQDGDRHAAVVLAVIFLLITLFGGLGIWLIRRARRT